MSTGEHMGGGSPTEIERKFLVSQVPTEVDKYPTHRIVQGYLAIEEGGTEVRIRSEECNADRTDYTLTVKSKGDLVRGEHETVITASQFGVLWPATEGRRIEKDRTTVPHGVYNIEVDRYLGELVGHTVAEVEFTSSETAAAFVSPEWFGEDVTAISALKNRSLAKHGWPAEFDEAAPPPTVQA